MSEKVIITSDSTTDLSPELLQKYQIDLLPLRVSINGTDYTDGIDVDPEFIYRQYNELGVLPQTAAPNIKDCTEFFRKRLAQGCSIVHFTISSHMSSTYQNSCIAAQEFDNVYVVDTENLSTGGGLLVLAACEMAKSGTTASEIADKCRLLAGCVDASFVIDSLEFLHKGGRCSSVAALGANLLKLKPCIVVRHGDMGVGKKYRGAFGPVLEKYIKDMLGDGTGIDTTRIFITHAGCDQAVIDKCIEQVRAYNLFDEILVTRAGCTVSSHCGRNTLGVLFIRTAPL